MPDSHGSRLVAVECRFCGVTSPTYNRGEWAELYVLAKVLCDQALKVQVHGEDTSTKFLTVQKVRRGTEQGAEAYSLFGDEIVCEHTNKKVNKSEICEHVNSFLQSIKKGKGISFSLIDGERLLSLLDIPQLKKGAGLKSDIYIDVIDPLTGTTGIQGYTIKALIGSKPTLFNASEPTNLTYRINPPLPRTEIDKYNKVNAEGKLVNGIRDTVANILGNGHTMSLSHMDSRFKANLELLDSNMPSFISELVITYYSRKLGKKSSIKDTVGFLSVSNPLGVSNPHLWYQHKMKDFLEATTYGMVPTKPYSGERTAAGGLLLVNKKGELTCFRLDDKDKTRDYLFEHTYLETAKREKHSFGKVENIGSETFLKLNLQVRYK